VIHIVMGRAIDFVALAHDVARDLAPTHVLLELARRLPVIFHQPGKVPFQLTFADGNPLAIPTLTPTATSAPAESRIDGLRGRLISSATYWALARHTMALAGPDDTVFATGEDVGIPLATARAGMHDPPRLLVTVHNIRRPRVSVAFRLFNTLQHVSEWVTPAPAQGAYLRSLGIPDTHIHMPPEQTDTLFYTPLGANTPPAALNPRPLIVSVGLERRDYRAQSTSWGSSWPWRSSPFITWP